VLFLERRAVRGIRREGELAQVLGGRARVLAKLALQLEQPLAEELELGRVHVFRLRHLEDFRLGQGLRFACHCSSREGGRRENTRLRGPPKAD